MPLFKQNHLQTPKSLKLPIWFGFATILSHLNHTKIMPKDSIVERAEALGAAPPDPETLLNKHRQIAESFEAQLAKAELLDENNYNLAGTQLSLSDYLTAVKMVIDDSFDHEVWVRAEIRAMNTKGGHYYFELAETDDADQITASCRATLWRFRAKTVMGKFAKITGQTLQAGVSVLVKCSASFHTNYGFSLNISDIDPNYTLGEIAAAYAQMKKRLAEEGLIHLNKQHPMPFDIRHVIVIAPEKAAGLGDFRAEADRLALAGACRFHYHHATFQGNHAPDEIRLAISESLSNFKNAYDSLPDLLVIIRGGGAVGDLAYLNNFELAALVAECPIPVWVGVGHERDSVILDEVAHTSFDTPSKVVLGIEAHLVKMTRQAVATMEHLSKLANIRLATAQSNSQRQIERIKRSSLHAISMAKKDNIYQLSHIKSTAKFRYHQEKLALSALLAQTQKSSLAITLQVKHATKTYLNQHKIVFDHLQKAKQDCRHLQSLILIQHPSRMLQKGYAIVNSTHSHKIIQSAKTLQKNQSVKITFKDGSANAIIQDVSMHPSSDHLITPINSYKES